jgi:hypothetical protein
MNKDEALKMALEALKQIDEAMPFPVAKLAQKVIKEALAQPQQEPVAWLLTDKNINSLQVDSIQRLIDRLKHAHHTDLCVRINGQDEWFQADWLKHMVRASPPQRTWVGLTDEERKDTLQSVNTGFVVDASVVALAIEAKLKEKNG